MRLIQISIIFVFAMMCIAAKPLPEGWRIPTKKEMNQDWRNDKPHRYLAVKADFNGDGITDQAMLLMKKNGEGMALFAFVSEGKDFKSFILDELKPQYMDVMGINLVKKGKYLTACGKGYFDCGPVESDYLILTLPAIDYINQESYNSFFYWNEKNKSFNRVWISD